MAWLSATSQLDLVAAGTVAARELRDAGIARCEALNPDIGFLVAERFERAPEGVPMLLKDAGQEIAGTPHWAGLASLRDAGSRSSRTTALARRFERLGFSIIGTSACPPLANGVTTEPPGFAPTRNPWDPSMSAGGSSGGAAAAVACGAVPIAHGSDATGSLRFPAALCGVTTLVPTAGLVPGEPPCGQPPSKMWRDFVIARDALDLTRLFRVLTGSEATGAEVRWLRVGVLDHDPELGLAVDDACVGAVHRVAHALDQLGHDVEPAWPTALDTLWQRAGDSFAVASDATRPSVLRWVEQRLGRPLEAGDVPTEVIDAAGRDAARSDGDRAAARATLEAAASDLLGWWRDHDLLVTPATFQAGWPLGNGPGPAQCGTLAAPFSLTAQPSVVIPVIDTDHSVAGQRVPVGVQIVGRRHADSALLQLATELQSILDWTRHAPPIFAG